MEKRSANNANRQTLNSKNWIKYQNTDNNSNIVKKRAERVNDKFLFDLNNARKKIGQTKKYRRQ